MMKNILPFILFSVVSCTALETPSAPRRTAQEIEKEEFSTLMTQDSLRRKKTAAESLEILLNENASSNRVSIIVNNNSNCNIILRFSGVKSYNLPIYRNNKNFIVIDKGTYGLGANMCSSRYSGSMTFDDSVTLNVTESQ